MKVGNGRLLKTVDGATHFARVSIRAVGSTGSSEAQVQVALEATDADARDEVAAELEHGWIAAAIAGATSAIEELTRLGIDVRGIRLLITHVQGSLLDTRDDTVACAAALAVGDALSSDLNEITVHATLVDSHWQAIFSRR